MGRETASTVIWFRRDLRTDDHPALLAAVEEAESTGGRVAPLFVADSGLLARSGSSRRRFLAGNLAALDAGLEGALTLRKGKPAEVVAAFAEVQVEAAESPGYECGERGCPAGIARGKKQNRQRRKPEQRPKWIEAGAEPDHRRGG